jgi:hypothetical protein
MAPEQVSQMEKELAQYKDQEAKRRGVLEALFGGFWALVASLIAFGAWTWLMSYVRVTGLYVAGGLIVTLVSCLVVPKYTFDSNTPDTKSKARRTWYSVITVILLIGTLWATLTTSL